MRSFFAAVKKYIIVFFVGIWDFVFFFFGMPYEEQASKLKLDEMDDLISGPENKKTTHHFFRANKVTQKDKEQKSE